MELILIFKIILIEGLTIIVNFFTIDKEAVNEENYKKEVECTVRK